MSTNTLTKTSLEKFFQPFRERTIGYRQTFTTPFGEKPIL